MIKYAFEGTVIILGILLSFYIEELRLEKKNIELKNEILINLTRTIDEDLTQISIIKDILQIAKKNIDEIHNDIDSGHALLSDEEVVSKLMDIEIGISFIPRDGIYNELISTGSFQLINNESLKSHLLEVYNHQKERNYSISKIIDDYVLVYRGEIFRKFSIKLNHLIGELEFYGKPEIRDFKFNKDYYLSGHFIGNNTFAKAYADYYLSLMRETESSYRELLVLCDEELS